MLTVNHLESIRIKNNTSKKEFANSLGYSDSWYSNLVKYSEKSKKLAEQVVARVAENYPEETKSYLPQSTIALLSVKSKERSSKVKEIKVSSKRDNVSMEELVPLVKKELFGVLKADKPIEGVELDDELLAVIVEASVKKARIVKSRV